MKKILIGLGAAALLAGQSAAVAANPASLERVSAAFSEDAEAAGSETYLLVALVLAAALGTVIVMSGDEDTDSELTPYSP